VNIRENPISVQISVGFHFVDILPLPGRGVDDAILYDDGCKVFEASLCGVDRSILPPDEAGSFPPPAKKP